MTNYKCCNNIYESSISFKKAPKITYGSLQMTNARGVGLIPTLLFWCSSAGGSNGIAADVVIGIPPPVPRHALDPEHAIAHCLDTR